jgi:CTP synthase (UTP-ammonia lyase)
MKIALIGDFDPAIVAHQAIPQSLALAAQSLGHEVSWRWLGTDALSDPAHQLADFAGIWCVPGSPYRSFDGALGGIRFARESRRPFLGTCGGFQHALIEYARHVAGLTEADHAETNAAATVLVITRLTCSLVGQQEEILFTPGSRLHQIYAGQASRERYHCNYGVNPGYRLRLEAAGLRFSGFDRELQIRTMELPSHPFFVGTLFQPERSALEGRTHPLITEFLRATR